MSQKRIRDLRRPGGVTNWGSIPPPRGRVEFWILLVFCPRAGGNGTATRNPPVCGGGTLACQVRILLVFCPRTEGNGIATRDPPDEGWHLHSHGLRSRGDRSHFGSRRARCVRPSRGERSRDWWSSGDHRVALRATQAEGPSRLRAESPLPRIAAQRINHNFFARRRRRNCAAASKGARRTAVTA